MERLNLTIRQGSAYLALRSPAHARGADKLCEHIELLKFYYNFVRRHQGLKFGRICRTPAMQAGLTKTPLSFREIFGLPAFSRPPAAILTFPTRSLGGSNHVIANQQSIAVADREARAMVHRAKGRENERVLAVGREAGRTGAGRRLGAPVVVELDSPVLRLV